MLHLSQHAPAKIAGISQVRPSTAKMASKKGLHPQLHTVDVRASCHGIAAPAHIAVEPMPQQNIRTTACCIWGSACPICRFLGSIQNHLKMTHKQMIKRNAFYNIFAVSTQDGVHLQCCSIQLHTQRLLQVSKRSLFYTLCPRRMECTCKFTPFQCAHSIYCKPECPLGGGTSRSAGYSYSYSSAS